MSIVVYYVNITHKKNLCKRNLTLLTYKLPNNEQITYEEARKMSVSEYDKKYLQDVDKTEARRRMAFSYYANEDEMYDLEECFSNLTNDRLHLKEYGSLLSVLMSGSTLGETHIRHTKNTPRIYTRYVLPYRFGFFC